MTTQEMAAEVALDILTDLAESGADVRSVPEASGARFTVEQHGTPLQQSRLSRLQAAAERKHGAETSRFSTTTKADAESNRRQDAFDRAMGLGGHA